MRVKSAVFRAVSLALSTAALCASTAGHAADGAESGDAASEASRGPDQYVIVTASREPEAAFDALAPVVVIDRATIERSLAADVGELLRFHAGIDVAQTGGPGQTTTVFMRGTNSNHTLVLVDGVRINPGTLGGAALQNIAPELIDHIEIVKGPRSSLYGTDAIGGVINIITRGADATRLEALAGGGRWDSREAAATGAWVGANGSLSFGTNWFETAGFPTFALDTRDRGYRNGSLTLAGRTSLGGVDLGARYWRAGGNQQYSDYLYAPISQDYRNSSFALDAGGKVSDHWHTKTVASHIVDDIRQVEPNPFSNGDRDYAITHRDALDWQNDIAAGAQQFTVGGLLTRENTRALSYGGVFDVDTRADTWYAEDRVTLGQHRLLGAVGYTRHSSFGNHTTWNAEYGFAPGVDTLLTVGAGTGFHAPTSTDRFGFGGNPQLKPEQSRNLEVGARRRVSARQTVALTAFNNDITDLINFVTVSYVPFAGANQNVASARVRGIELSWDYSTELWQGHLEATHQDPVDRSDDSRLLRRARVSASASLARRLGRQELGLEVLASGDRYDIGFPSNVRLGGYTLVNASWRTPLVGGLKLQLRVENLFDKRYEYASGYNTMRRGLYAALRYEFL